jgi:hypothetical protein
MDSSHFVDLAPLEAVRTFGPIGSWLLARDEVHSRDGPRVSLFNMARRTTNYFAEARSAATMADHEIDPDRSDRQQQRAPPPK